MSKTRILNKFVSLLNSLNKEYKIENWGSGDGTDIIIPHYSDDIRDDTVSVFKVDYEIVISINDTDYVNFEWREVKDG